MKKKIVKFVSVFLCILIAFSCVQLMSFAKENELKFTVASDTHFQCKTDVGSLTSADDFGEYAEGMLNKDTFFHATMQGQMNHESEAIMRSMLNDFVKSDSEYLLIPGDLTGGKRQSHKELAKLLKDAENKSGKQIFVICGNHDCDTDNLDKYIDIKEFKQIYADFGFKEAIASDTSSASYVVNLSAKYRLIAIDSCIYGEDNGKVSDSTLNWVIAQAEQAKKDGKYAIAMMHHSLLPHFSVQPMIKNYAKIAEALANAGIKLVFTGHLHANDISMANTDEGNTIYDIQTGSLITSPNAYREVIISDEKISIESQYVTEIDTKYLPDGFSDVQISAINNDFSSYAYSYFEAGICRWLNRYIGSAGKVGKMMKLSPDSVGYKLLDSLMKNVGEALLLPIYDDGKTPDRVDSIEEIAKLANVDIPKSDYIMVYQLAAKIFNGFYHGDEAESIKTVEFPLFYDCFKAVLVRTISNLAFSTNTAKLFNAVSQQIFGVAPYEKMLTDSEKILYSSKAADNILQSLLYNLCDGLVEDLSEPSDINVVIDGYGKNDTAQKEFQLNVFKRIIFFLKNFIVYLFKIV
ncbi:MAG: metallophosphoesterase [Clostridia bacterium]|nr:metallophosphoesterase [Clostridia bacterium]